MKTQNPLRLFISIMLFSICCLPMVSCDYQGVELTDEELTALVKEAYIYSYPLYVMYKTRYKAVYDTTNPKRTDLNCFYHSRDLNSPDDRNVTTPNNDTLISGAWLDLSLEPVILSVPVIADSRYYVMPLMDMYTNVGESVGIRTTGNGAGDYMIVGPNWKGCAPAGVTVLESPTNWVWLIGRTLVYEPDDLETVRVIQDQYKLTPLTVWKGIREKGLVQTNLDHPPLAPDTSDPWNFFKIVNLCMTLNPPPVSEDALMEDFAQIGVGPRQIFCPYILTEAQQQVVQDAMTAAFNEIYSKINTMPFSAGWIYPPSNMGDYGTDYIIRAAVALVGLGALQPAEAYYIAGVLDSMYTTYDSANNYVLHFDAGELPPVEAHGFWSLTMYEVTPEGTQYLAPNPIDRYSIGDRTQGLQYNADGSLDIYIQRESPGGELLSNWLPSPSSGIFRMTMRAYLPGEAVIDGTYRVPGVVKQ